jgi:membrane dipeptidase
VDGFTEAGLPMHVDLPRLRAGKVGGTFWSVFTPCPKNATDMSDATYAQSVRDTLQQIDVMNRLRAAYPSVFSPSGNSSHALAAFRKGQIISPLGVEGLHQIGNSAANLRAYHALGVRYATLTHNCPNRYADAALWEDPIRLAPSLWGGVSDEGRKLVQEMNRLGMFVDLAHTSVETMKDVLGGGERGWEGSIAPIIFSHSSAYAICPHPRNVPDDVLALVKARRSLVMINFSPDFISCIASQEFGGLPDFYPPNATLAHVVTHIKYIGGLIGYDHVGLGSDFDGIGSTPKGLEDVSKYPDLVAEMLKQGVSDDDAAKVAGGNLLRVWRDVDDIALQLQASSKIPILEDDLPSLRPP